jgi:hypothetical protein
MPLRTNLICQDITKCKAAGGFGKFLETVSGGCRSKTFSGYYGLDDMTFGIVDFTSNELPPLFEIYQQRSPDKFVQIFGGLNLLVLESASIRTGYAEGTALGTLIVTLGFVPPLRSPLKIRIYKRDSSNLRSGNTTAV